MTERRCRASTIRPVRAGEVVRAASGLDEEEGGGGAYVVVQLGHIELGEGEPAPLPGQQLVDGRLARAARALDAGADDAPLAEPEATDLVRPEEDELARASLEIEKREHRGEPELLE